MTKSGGEKWRKVYIFISLQVIKYSLLKKRMLMLNFLGNIEAKIDTKGRVFVPSSFRKILVSSAQTTLILKKDIFQDCLVLYPESIWEEEVVTLRTRLNRWNKQQTQLFRQFVIDAERLEIDANGRILIPKRYLQMLNIASDITFLGVDNLIEIWTKDALDKSLVASDDFGMQIESLMKNNQERI